MNTEVFADTTYRIIALHDREIVGQTAETPELAKLVAPDVDRTEVRLGLERTDWGNRHGTPQRVRTVLVAAEKHPGEWDLAS
jgi:hypothetical protein